MFDPQRKSGNVIAIQIKSFCGSWNKREGKTKQKKAAHHGIVKSSRKLGAI